MNHTGESAVPSALVTGASDGLGRALARRLAAAGWRVGLVARRGELLAQACDEIGQTGGVARFRVADVRNAEQLAQAVAELADELGPCELAIANAGVAPVESIRPIKLADVRKMIEVNYLGMVHTIAAVLPTMLERRTGHLAAVSSLAAFRGLPSMAGYAASKAAVNTFLDGLRVELRGTGVRVTTLCPGFIATKMTARNVGAMPMLMQADDVARRMLWALRHERKVFAFPRPLAWAMQVARFAPDWLIDRISPREEVIDQPKSS